MDTAAQDSPWDFLLMRTVRLLAELETLRHQIANLNSSINDLVERFDLVGSRETMVEEEEGQDEGVKNVLCEHDVWRRLEEIDTVKVSSWCEGESVCTVCMEGFESGCEAKRLECSHMYHRDCIGGWIAYKNLCPLCRSHVY